MEDLPNEDKTSSTELQDSEALARDSTEAGGPHRRPPEAVLREKIQNLEAQMRQTEDLDKLKRLDIQRTDMLAELAMWQRPIEPED